MKILGITGPTGAGKTTALNVLTSLGACILDADAVYHDLLEQSRALREALTGRFGDICDETGKIDRKKLGGVVFTDPAALTDLNGITHRFMEAELDRRLREAEQEGRPAAAIDAIALLESGFGAKCDATVAVVAPAELRVRRIMARDGIDERYARMRISAQKSDEFYRGKCDYELSNTAETPEDFREIARDFFRRLIGELREEKNEASR